MAKSNNQKAKILYLERILLKTGKDCTVSMQEILNRLAEKGVTAERKSIYDDLEVLRGFGMDIRYRRGKPGGYYLAGRPADLKAEPGSAPEETAAETDLKSVPERAGLETDCQIVPEKEPAEPKGDYESGDDIPAVGVPAPSWLDKTADRKQVKLICENSARGKVEKCIGEEGLYKEKGMTMFTVAAEIAETPEFYGWLTAMGRSVRILKPRKAALAYRDYLKDLAREYKGI